MPTRLEELKIHFILPGEDENRLSIATGTPPKVSICCDAKIDFSRGDGVSMGSCQKCGVTVIRINPRTGNQEWLRGHSPWTEKDAAEATNG